jgi:hypothetical protein
MSALSIDGLTVVQPSNGQNNGALSNAVVSGGTAPYTYQWGAGGGSSTPFFYADARGSSAGLSPGTYGLTVTDSVSASVTKSYVLVNTVPLSATYGAVTNATGTQSNGAIAATTVTGGTAPYTASWATTATALPAPTSYGAQSGLAAGDYTLTLTSADSQTATHKFTVASTPVLAATYGAVTNATGTQSNGSIAATTVTGGTAPYTASWATTATALPAPTSYGAQSGLAAGDYTLTLTSADSQTATHKFTVASTSVLAATYGAVTNATGTQSNGAIAATTVTGGTAPYTASWATTATALPAPTSYGAQSGLAAGDYTLTLTSADSQTATHKFTVASTPVLAATYGAVTNATGTQSNGAIAATTVTGGTAPYTASWATTATALPAPTSYGAQSGLAAGDYTLTLTSADSQTATHKFTVASTPVLSATYGAVTNAIGTQSNGSIAATTVTGGTAPYTASWATTATALPAPTSYGAQSGLKAGDYTLTLTSADSQTATHKFTVTSRAALRATFGTVSEATTGQTDGEIAATTVTGGTAPYTASWTTTATALPAPTSYGAQSGLGAGTYVLTITSADNQTVSNSYTITSTSGPVTPLNVVYGGVTNATGTQSNGAIAATTVTGGTAPYTASWTTTATALPAPTSYGAQSGLAAGTYKLTITSADNQTDSNTFTVASITALSATFGAVTGAAGTQKNGAIAASTVSGGTGPYTASWATTATALPAPTSYGAQSGLAAGDYTLTITSADGQTATHKFSVSGTPALAAVYGAVTNSTTGTATDGAIAASTVSGGTAPYTASWTTTATALPAPTSYGAQSGIGEGNYVLTITDAAAQTLTHAFHVGAQDDLIFTAGRVHNKPTFAAQEGAIAPSTIFGGKAPFTAVWTGAGDVSGLSGLDGGKAEPGVYTLTITDANNRTVVQTFTVGHHDKLYHAFGASSNRKPE